MKAQRSQINWSVKQIDKLQFWFEDFQVVRAHLFGLQNLLENSRGTIVYCIGLPAKSSIHLLYNGVTFRKTCECAHFYMAFVEDLTTSTNNNHL